MERKRNASGTFKKEYSDKQLLDFIKNKFNEIGEVPRINNFKKYKFPSLLTWYRRFGSYTNAVKLCNLPPRKRGAQFKIDKMSRSDISKKYYSTPKGIFNVIKKNGKKRNLEIGFEQEEFINWHKNQDKKCFYCDVPEEKLVDLTQISSKKISRLTIDRVDNNKGYVVGNIVLCCDICNHVKSNIFSPLEMKKIAKLFIKPKWQKQQ